MALPMVLWAIALLTAVTLLLAGVINGWIEEESHAGKAFQARLQALSGIAIAMNPGIHSGDPLLKQGSQDEGWSVVLADESGLINPNHFLNPDQRALLKQLFANWKLSPDQAETAADGLFDWQSSSPFKSLKGAKKEEYAAAGYSGLPPGAHFVSPEEMELVIGFAPVMEAKSDWRSYFTTYYPGPVNLMHAPKRVLTDFLGFTPIQADAWIALRNGPDGIEGSGDEKPYTIDDAFARVGLTPPTIIKQAVTTQGSVRRIESTGRWHGVTHRIIVVADPSAQGAASMLGWSEE
jgi:hypothetical protein